MKKTSLQINIENPCHEDWHQMTNIEQGRYCSYCCKSVIDFSNMSDREIIRLLEKNAGQLCGRFTTDQVNRPLVHSTSSRKHHSIILAGLLLLGIADFSFAKPPLKENTELAIHATQNLQEEVFDDFLPKDSTQNTIEGRVTREGKGLENVTVQIKNTKISTFTNKDGYYKIEIPNKSLSSNMMLVFRGIGCRSEEIIIQKNQLPLKKNIEMSIQQMIMGKIIAQPIPKKTK
ncbi:MAG: hypothetical protein DI598_03075 [Pseudopedobacter saltans]|uniref:TonB-dependent receptor n=1 Tax=Pseudopedobacter saltans TaxID=151895 RepID=A0A2W5HCR7_9SPHI|nr:MAG: hypothetical protein DI598_03075 [Pseudopedobacter saltans]